MNWIRSALTSRKWAESSGCYLAFWNNPSTEIRLGPRGNVRATFVAAAALSLISGSSYGQTTPTNSTATSTSRTIPSSSSTSANSPCDASNPTSPCYTANAPRSPCYSAAAPDQRCSTATAPYSRTSPPPRPPAAKTTQAAARAVTEDQARSQIEAKGYSNVSGLRKDAKGTWGGRAEKDGLSVNVTLDADGDVSSN